MKKFLPAGVILLVAGLLYIPTLRTGFLADDFLDSECTIHEVPRAFVSLASSGYRPLMSLSWAIDNLLWGKENQAGWHLTNIIILLATVFMLYRFLSLYLKSTTALVAALMLFTVCLPVTASVAKVVWRTSLLPMIPLLAAFVFVHRWGTDSGRWWQLCLSSILLLVSLFLKELALASPPVFAVIVLTTDHRRNKWRKPLIALAASGIAVLAYGLTRYFAVGFSIGYSSTLTFGFFMFKNIMLLGSMVLDPWLSTISVRVLVLVFALLLWCIPGGWRHRMLVVVLGVFMLLPVSNLPLRPDYAVAGVPALALALGFVVQENDKKKFVLPVLIILFTGIFLHSRDEISILADASDYVDRTTERLAEIADELPGGGPLFVDGIHNTVGTYGTFWPGEYMLPMECLGIQPGRFIAGTDRIWEVLITEDNTGFLVFMSDDAIHYTSVPVSADMYPGLPDTTVILSGSISAGELIRYPSCSGPDESGSLYLVSSIYLDSVITIYPDFHDGVACYDLASVPVWLAASEYAVLIGDGPVELVFSSRNISLERALEIIESKTDQSAII
ncbi:MAG: hypothetical protein K8S62_06615 [Candidatus Sabulitectum sp.]|nr:hypothetical protein [Candidatus Sabulitectum sp.]